MRIRLARASDAEAVAAIYRPAVEAGAVSFETEPPGTEETARRIAERLESYPWLICDVDGRAAGYAYASQHRTRAAYRWSVDVSIYVDGAYHRRGIGRGLYLSLFGILVAQGYFNAYAGITLPNAASVGLHESIGFRPVGVYERVGFKLGAWHDVGWWQLALQPHHDAPAEPTRLSDLHDDGRLPGLLALGESGPE